MASGYDVGLFDLDGTLYAGPAEIPGAVDAVAASGLRPLYVTNNASRTPADVAEHLTDLGFPATVADVVTSAQAGAALVADLVPAGAMVLVVGTDALAAECEARGLRVTRRVTDAPVAVVQGHSPLTAWADLAEACIAIRGGARWVACNLDPTLPTERGQLPGNGSMVAALRYATGREPAVAGKPGRRIMDESVIKAGGGRALVIGDRLDTDVAGAVAAGLDSALVLTGIMTAFDALRAREEERPTYVVRSLADLLAPVADGAGWDVERRGDELVVATGPGAREAGLFSALSAVAWSGSAPSGVVAADGVAAAACRAWRLPVMR